MKYNCTKCDKQRNKEDFKVFDKDLETGICWYCEPPERDSPNHIQRVMVLGDSDRIKELEQHMTLVEKYNIPKEKLDLPETEKMKWNDQRAVFNYFNKQNDTSKSVNITYDQVKVIFWLCYMQIVKFETGKSITDIAEIQKPVFESFIKWLIKEESELDINKSLIISGGVGIGKTTLVKAGMNTMRYINSKLKWDNRYKVKEMDSLIFDLKIKQNLEPISELNQGRQCIDDIRKEHKYYKHYGNDIELIDLILSARHLNWKSKKEITIITTNIKKEEWSEVLQGRMLSRLKQEYQIIEMQGENKRSTLSRV